LQTVHQSIDEFLAHVGVNIQLGITGELDAVGRNRIGVENEKQVVQTIPDNVIQQNNELQPIILGQDQEAGNNWRWNLHQCIPHFLSEGQFNDKVRVPVLKFRKWLRCISPLQHNGHQGRQNMPPKVLAHITPPPHIQLLFIDDEDFLGFELLDDFLLIQVVKPLLETNHRIFYFIQDFLGVEPQHGFGFVVDIYQAIEGSYP